MGGKTITYADAGVNIAAADRLVHTIKKITKTRKQPGSAGKIGGFSGLFDPAYLKIKQPYLVASTDGVGTKLAIAQLLNKHDTVGIDLVAMSVNDLICTGAKPLFFLDYFACGKLYPQMTAQVIRGIQRGCEQADCLLIGGETAEMAGFYEGKKYDLAGFAVGMVDKNKVVDGSKVKAGDMILGLASSGFHSNGYSLLRKVFSKKEMAGAWGRTLLTPTRIYVRPVLKVLSKVKIKGIAHITGGAYYDKIPRVIPNGLCARINARSWLIPKIFREVQKRACLPDKEIFHTLNMGIGMILIAEAKQIKAAQSILKQGGLASWVIGKIEKNKQKVVIDF